MSTEFIGMGELTRDRDHQRISHVDLCGVAGVSIFYLAMKHGLDLLLKHPKADRSRVAMTGLSGGGWQTAVLGALDERITTLIPVAGHSPVWQRVNCMADIGDLEQNPVDLCTVADYDQMTALFAPRPALLIYNLRDNCCFRSRRTYRSIYQPVKPVYERLGVGDDLEFYENWDPGTHNYESDNRSRLYRFLNRQFNLDTSEKDLPFEDELLSERDLEVGVPNDNATIISIAGEYANRINHSRVIGKTQVRAKRKEIAEVIRLRRAKKVQASRVSGTKGLRQHRLSIDAQWTVPVTEMQGRGKRTLILSDGGRKAASRYAHRFDGSVYVADVYGIGENWLPPRYHMTLGVTGERPLGILVGQIMDVARWAAGSSKVHMDLTGPVVCFGGLCAAALDPKPFASLTLDGMHDSLRRLIDMPVHYDDACPLFCFGLLKTTDVTQLLDLVDGLPVEWLNRGPVYSGKDVRS